MAESGRCPECGMFVELKINDKGLVSYPEHDCKPRVAVVVKKTAKKKTAKKTTRSVIDEND